MILTSLVWAEATVFWYIVFITQLSRNLNELQVSNLGFWEKKVVLYKTGKFYRQEWLV